MTTRPFHHAPRRIALLTALVCASLQAHAQTAPDAGRTLQETAPPVLLPPRPAPELSIQSPLPADIAPGGAKVTLQSVSLSGNTVFGSDVLLPLLGETSGQSFDLAGLRALASRITEYYRANGYPFARALIPAQSMQDGLLRIEVVEGRYGAVKAVGDTPLAEAAQAFLAPLKLKGSDVIESKSLERIALILDDQPGLRATPIIRPGQETGTGDLEVRIERTQGVSGEAGLDNHGNRYTGQSRARANLDLNSPFMLGDQITLRLLGTEQNMWLGSVGYNLPLGTSGLRGQLGYSHTAYQLGSDFANLDATGYARVTTAGLSYPLLRSQQSNLTLSGSWQHKSLNDRQGSASTDNRKSSDAAPLALIFDRRDGLGGGGITYGALTWTTGQLWLDATLRATDQTSARTEGHFSRLNLDIARLQAIDADLTLFGRASIQRASKNLDSSERFGLGGPSGVRAYPVGESFGDEGWLIQLEARYRTGPLTPYVFYDAGEIRTNARPWQAGNNQRFLSGSGIGLRAQQGPWNLDATLAWRQAGGKPESDTRDTSPLVWLNAFYRF